MFYNLIKGKFIKYRVKILKKKLILNYKMEGIKEEVKETEQAQTQEQAPATTSVPDKDVEVKLSLLSNLRNIIDVVNTRGFNWKTEELLPVCLVVNQVDDLLKENGVIKSNTE